MNREMGRALVNLSGSFLFVSASDYACGCLDPEGNILTTIAWSLQMGFAMSNTVRASLERFEGDLHPGDMIFANDPYDGGGLHSHDVVVVAPVFRDGELVMWVGVSAHVTDVGGAVAGGYAIEPMECYGENLRFTPVKFYDQGKFRGDIIDAFLTNTRVPKQTGIDIKALLGAVWIGRERLDALLDQHGAERIREIHAAQIEASGRAFTERLRALPDGAYSGAAHMEHDGASDRIYTIRATVIKEGDRLTVDYTGTDPQAPGALNCTDVGGVGNVIAAVGTVLAPDIPFNQGLLAPVDIVSPAGTLVNAVKPAPISGATVYGAWFGTDAILEAINYMIAGSEETGASPHRAVGLVDLRVAAGVQPVRRAVVLERLHRRRRRRGRAAVPRRRERDDGHPDRRRLHAEHRGLRAPEPGALPALRRGARQRRGGRVARRAGRRGVLRPLRVRGLGRHRVPEPPDRALLGGRRRLPGRGRRDPLRARRAGGRRAALGRARARAGRRLSRRGRAAARPRARGFRVELEDGYYIRATGGPGHGDPLERAPERVAADVARGYVSRRGGRFGVRRRRGGRRRSTRRRTRVAALGRARDCRRCRSAAVPARTAPGSGGDLGGLARRAGVLSEALAVDAAGRYRCRRCDHDLGGNRSNWKYFALAAEAAVSPAVDQQPDRRARPPATSSSAATAARAARRSSTPRSRSPASRRAGTTGRWRCGAMGLH